MQLVALIHLTSNVIFSYVYPKDPKDIQHYVLLVDKFESSVTTDEQLIEIFKQSNIRVIFANQIIPEIQLNQRDNVSTLVTYQPAQPITQQTQPISVTNANEIIQALQRKIEEQENELKIYKKQRTE